VLKRWLLQRGSGLEESTVLDPDLFFPSLLFFILIDYRPFPFISLPLFMINKRSYLYCYITKTLCVSLKKPTFSFCERLKICKIILIMTFTWGRYDYLKNFTANNRQTYSSIS
jgi:hypothetical protein